jgi:mannose-6-phosphate isomerase-like protein (cupin superfamily)
LSFFRATDTGTILLGPGDIYTLLAAAAETGGDYIALEALVPPEGGPPLHVHHNQIETFYILEGEMEMTLGDQVYEAKAGDFIHVSKDTPHKFQNRSRTTTKMIFTFVPAGDIEEFFRESFKETTDRNPPLEALTDEFIQRMIESANRHDIEILPPPEG